ncbi:lytic transglycosylase domain-containing protein [Microbacterium sp. SSW1-59]|uniref:aggregation-promoting factor C-terminal-like domain-containing protein n=1 Tax=Microbacterium xanthum TaxID=3079794 RepID=UPI002AD436CA|nr:lytic transglycosylase domain-containing protein [Microbacterium sp. SSW1-59]MDZ8201935.1 lytic transglycosylase domain-containing protein [Microbacterium sp. SSW1-59]
MTEGSDLTPTRRSRRDVVPASASRAPSAVPTPRWSRRRGVLAVFATVAAFGFVVAYAGPTGLAVSEAGAEAAQPVTLYASTLGDVQTLVTAADDDEVPTFDRGNYEVYVTPTPTPTPEPVAAANTESSGSSAGGWAPPFVTPDPGSAQAIAYDMVAARGWGDGEFSCLVALWNKESGWRVNAYNASSGAYGIPQSLPGNKMASAGADWETNPATQIAWGLGYIGGRYGAPCGAWGHSQAVGWY